QTATRVRESFDGSRHINIEIVRRGGGGHSEAALAERGPEVRALHDQAAAGEPFEHARVELGLELVDGGLVEREVPDVHLAVLDEQLDTVRPLQADTPLAEEPQIDPAPLETPVLRVEPPPLPLGDALAPRQELLLRRLQ